MANAVLQAMRTVDPPSVAGDGPSDDGSERQRQARYLKKKPGKS